MKKYIILILSIAVFFACESKKGVLEQATYDGPSVTMDSIDVKISDSTVTKIRLRAPKQYVYENDDRDFPHGIYLQFYDPFGKVTSTLKANTGYYFSDEDYYKAEGDVIMISLRDGSDLRTELLNWVPKEERIYTDQFVTIKTDGEVLEGEGLESNEDFSEYTILKPSGVMSILKTQEIPVGEVEQGGFDDELEYIEMDSTEFLE
ncbi:MAG: LPS export ABC transporter periplasmic protein LptC [Reichenbachiella sp.]